VSIVTEECGSRQVPLADEKQAGDARPYWSEASFRQIFLEHYASIVGVLHRLVGERTRAEELTLEAFWRLYHQLPLAEPDGNISGWLYRTATRLGIDSLRAATRREHYEQEAGRSLLQAYSPSDPLEEVLRAEKCSRVRAVLAALRPAQAQILILRASGFSYEELALVLGVKRGSVGTMLRRAEAEFRKRYIRRHGKEESV
jgi:RNA polymerase sigma factor (sigma-70 family)